MTVTTYPQITPRRTAIPLGVIWYSQSAVNPYTKRRSDCSGLISYVWDLPMTGPGTYLGAFSTTTLYSEGMIVEIPFADLKVGDAIGHCGPDSAGNNGHIALWLGYGDGSTPKPGGRHHVWDHGSGWGPKDRWVQWDGVSTGWLHPSNLGAWRLYTLASGTGGMSMLCKRGDNGPVVEAMQRVGLAAGGSLPQFGADADYGGETAAMVAAVGGGDGSVYGPSQYAAFFVKLAQRNGSSTPGPAGPPGPKGDPGPKGEDGLGAGDPVTIVGTVTAG